MRHELPSTHQRRVSIQTILTAAAANGTASAHDDAERLTRMPPLIDQSQPIEDLIFSFFHDQHLAIMVSAARKGKGRADVT